MFILILIFVYSSLYHVASERPDFRKDYVYEKAFKTFYKLHQSATTWGEAKIRCEAEGTTLMIPETLDEADAMPVLIAPILAKYEGVYVGLHDLYTERLYTTVKGKYMQNSILSLLWEKNEPKPDGGRCLGMHRNGRFFVNPCTNMLPFICKIKAKDIAYNAECKSFDSRWKPNTNDSCFYIHMEPQTWYQAYTTCLGSGGYLLIINDRTEAKNVRDLFKSVPKRRVPDNNFAFLGFSDLHQRHHYRTVHDQKIEDLRYSDWDSKCPEKPKIAFQKRCGGVRRNGLLASEDCDVPAMFFCEKSRNATISTMLLRDRTLNDQYFLRNKSQNTKNGDMDELLQDIL